MLHIKERFCRSLSNTGEGKHSLYCADLSLSPYFIPPLPGPRKDSLILSPRNKLGGLRTTHRVADWSFLLPLLSGSQCFVLFFYGHSLSFIFVSPSLWRSTSPLRAGWLRWRKCCVPTLPYLPSPLLHCALLLCLFECADVNCREDGHLAWYICSRDHPAGPGRDTGNWGCSFQHLRCSQGPRSWMRLIPLCHHWPTQDYDTSLDSCHLYNLQVKDTTGKQSVSVESGWKTETCVIGGFAKATPSSDCGRKAVVTSRVNTWRTQCLTLTSNQGCTSN